MITWRLFPFLRIAISLIGGISFHYFYAGMTLLFCAFIISSIVLQIKNLLHPQCIFNTNAINGFCTLLLFFSIGYVRKEIDLSKHQLKHHDKIVPFHNISEGIGIIQEIPIRRTSLRTEMELLYLCDSSHCYETKGKIIAYFKLNDSIALSYRPGDKIYFVGELREVPGNSNPHSFDFKNYLANRSIYYQVYIWGEEQHQIIASNQLVFYEQMAMNSRESFLSILSKYVKGKDELAISSAMILGYRNLVSEDVYQAFSDSGAVHILAVSGMHLGILSSGLMFFLERRKSANKKINGLKFIFVISILWFFTLITGAAPAIIRAAIMFTIIIYARYFKPMANVYNILSFCAIAMLMYDPKMVFQASFQFSFLAILSLIFFQPMINQWYYVPNKVLRYIWELTSVAIAAQILVIPITIYFFHKMPVYFIITGVISVFLSNLALYTGLLLFTIEYFLPPLNFIVAIIFNVLMKWFVWSVRVVKELPFCSIDGIVITNLELILFYLFLMTFMLYLLNKKFVLIHWMSITTMLFVFSVGLRTYRSNHQMAFTIYDVRHSIMIDVFDGRTVYGLGSDVKQAESNLFINQNNRYSMGVVKEHHLSISQNFTGSRIQKKGNCILFENYVLTLVDGNTSSDLLTHAHFLFITQEAKLDPKCLKSTPHLVILDRNLDKIKREAWLKYFKKQSIQIHDIHSQGALHINL